MDPLSTTGLPPSLPCQATTQRDPCKVVKATSMIVAWLSLSFPPPFPFPCSDLVPPLLSSPLLPSPVPRQRGIPSAPPWLNAPTCRDETFAFLDPSGRDCTGVVLGCRVTRPPVTLNAGGRKKPCLFVLLHFTSWRTTTLRQLHLSQALYVIRMTPLFKLLTTMAPPPPPPPKGWNAFLSRPPHTTHAHPPPPRTLLLLLTTTNNP